MSFYNLLTPHIANMRPCALILSRAFQIKKPLDALVTQREAFASLSMSFGKIPIDSSSFHLPKGLIKPPKKM